MSCYKATARGSQRDGSDFESQMCYGAHCLHTVAVSRSGENVEGKMNENNEVIYHSLSNLEGSRRQELPQWGCGKSGEGGKKINFPFLFFAVVI